eukprot:gene12937-biopygen12521
MPCGDRYKCNRPLAELCDHSTVGATACYRRHSELVIARSLVRSFARLFVRAFVCSPVRVTFFGAAKNVTRFVFFGKNALNDGVTCVQPPALAQATMQSKRRRTDPEPLRDPLSLQRKRPVPRSEKGGRALVPVAHGRCGKSAGVLRYFERCAAATVVVTRTVLIFSGGCGDQQHISPAPAALAKLRLDCLNSYRIRFGWHQRCDANGAMPTVRCERCDANGAMPRRYVYKTQASAPARARAGVAAHPPPLLAQGTGRAGAGHTFCWEKRLRTRPGRVRFFKIYRVGRVRGAGWWRPSRRPRCRAARPPPAAAVPPPPPPPHRRRRSA